MCGNLFLTYILNKKKKGKPKFVAPIFLLLEETFSQSILSLAMPASKIWKIFETLPWLCTLPSMTTGSHGFSMMLTWAFVTWIIKNKSFLKLYMIYTRHNTKVIKLRNVWYICTYTDTYTYNMRESTCIYMILYI